jgi:hypothetical protein
VLDRLQRIEGRITDDATDSEDHTDGGAADSDDHVAGDAADSLLTARDTFHKPRPSTRGPVNDPQDQHCLSAIANSLQAYP